MTNKEAKEMCKKIATMESELAAMKKAFSKKMVNRSPQKLPCDIEEFCKHIEDDGLPEDLIAGDYIDFELLTGEPVRAYVCGVCHDKAIDDTMADYTFAITRLDGDFEMNTKCDNSTSWENSKGRIYAERIAVSDFILGRTDVHELIAGDNYSIDDIVGKLDNLEQYILRNSEVK